MALQKTQGFVLRRDDIRETSILLTAYTRDFGKIKLISKGVRIPEQRFISAYELFSLDEIVFYEKKKKGFFLLSQCELINFFPEVRKELERISYAAYFVEFLDSTAPLGERNEGIYELLQNCLELLSTKASPKRVARIFEIKLLSILGFMPRLKFCAECNKEIKAERARFSMPRGGVICDACFAKDRNAKPVLAGTVRFISDIERLPFDRIKHIKVSSQVGSEVERLLGNFIDYHLDIKLKTRNFINKISV